MADLPSGVNFLNSCITFQVGASGGEMAVFLLFWTRCTDGAKTNPGGLIAVRAGRLCVDRSNAAAGSRHDSARQAFRPCLPKSEIPNLPVAPAVPALPDVAAPAPHTGGGPAPVLPVATDSGGGRRNLPNSAPGPMKRSGRAANRAIFWLAVFRWPRSDARPSRN